MRFDWPKSLPQRWRRTALGLAIAFVVYSLTGFFLVPWLLKWQLVKRLPDLTHRRVAVQQVRVNPWTLSLTVRGLALAEPDGRPFASWDELYVNFQASSLFRWAWTFSDIRLVNPFGEAILLADGRLNFANLFEAPTNAPPPAARSGIPRINVFNFAVTNGFVALEDRTRRSVFRTEYRPINLQLRDFTTRPESDTPYSFRAESDAGRSVTWTGDFTVQPLRSSGHLEVNGILLPHYGPYLEDWTRAVLTNGLADVQLDYRFAASTNGLDLVVTNAATQVAQVQVLDPDTGETVAGLRGLELKRAGFDLRANTLNIGAATISEATLLARLKPDGRLNLLELLRLPGTPAAPTNAPAAPGAPASPLVVAIGRFAVEQTAVRFEDRSLPTPFQTELKPIAVEVNGFSTAPDQDARYSFRVVSEAAEAFAGTGSFSINPLRSTGEVTVSELDLKKYLPYAEPFFRGMIVGGRAEARAPYQAALGPSGWQAAVTNLSLKLSAIEVQMPETAERVTQIREIGFERVEASLENRTGRVGLFTGDKGSVLVRRNQDGTLNLLGLFAVARTNVTSRPAEPAPSPGTATGASTNVFAVALGGWTLRVDEIRLADYAVTVEDRVPSKPATMVLDQLRLNVRDVSTVAGAQLRLDTAFRLNETGTVAARGSGALWPPSAAVAIALTNLDLRAAQPYLEPWVAMSLVSGALSTTGTVRFQPGDAAEPQLAFTGGLQITNFAAADADAAKEFARWDQLAVSGIEAAVNPTRLKIDEVRLVRPRASLTRGADGGLNLPVIRAAGDGPSGAAGAASTPPPVQLGTLALEGASFAFADESVRPPVVLGIDELSGTIQGLTSALETPAKVDLAGQVDAQSPFAIRGTINPFPATRHVDLEMTNANTQLTPLTGYLEKYGGYPLRKGRLSSSLHYRVDGNALDAANQIQVDQLTLGPRNDSPDATKLPIKLGVALLKDSEGRIELDLPLKGRLDDPEFSLAPVLLKVVVNTIVKAAASPFKLLGALAGGGGDELSFVQFAPGSTNLMEGEPEKLGKLAAALAKRPALNLEIEGAADPQLDRAAIARQKLDAQLVAQRREELTRKGRAPEPGAAFELDPVERERLVRAAFVEQFGTNVAEVIQANLARFVSTNQTAGANAGRSAPRPKRTFVQRLTGVFGGGSGGRTKAEKRLPKEDREALAQAPPDMMEVLLAERIEVKAEEFRQLMTARARWVQDWLIREGQVAADRILLVAPKPVDAAYAGEARVNLSLD